MENMELSIRAYIGDSEAHTLETVGTYQGLWYYGTATTLGHRCGYVVVPPGVNPDAQELHVHGGVTYDAPVCFPSADQEYRVVGFDTGHFSDARDPNLMVPETREAMAPLLNLGGTHRDADFVEAECQELCRQIAEPSQPLSPVEWVDKNRRNPKKKTATEKKEEWFF